VNAAGEGSQVRKVAVDLTGWLSAQLVLLGIGMMLAAVRGRGLGIEAFGVFSLAILVPMLLSALLDMGVSRANAYFIGRADVCLRDALKRTLKMWLASSVLGLAIGGLVIVIKAADFFPGVPRLVLWAALGLFPVVQLRGYLLSLLRGLKDFRWYNRVQLFDATATLVFTLAAILVFEFGTVGAVVAYCAGMTLGVPVCLWRLRRHLAKEAATAPLPFATPISTKSKSVAMTVP